MHQAVRADHVAAEDVADALVPEADAEQRRVRAEAPDDVIGNARLRRRAGAGRNADALGLQLGDLIERDLVVAPHEHLRPSSPKY